MNLKSIAYWYKRLPSRKRDSINVVLLKIVVLEIKAMTMMILSRTHQKLLITKTKRGMWR